MYLIHFERKKHMSKIRIATDSTSDIPKALQEELDITVLPLTIICEDKEYSDGCDITPEEFYEILETSEKIPGTSRVTPVLYAELFEKAFNDGCSDLIVVCLNSKGSGTWQGAVMAKEAFFEETPEAKGKLEIYIIDSKTYSMAYGWAVVEAAKLIKEDAPLEKVLECINEWLNNVCPVFLANNLKFIKKSGRISAAAALVGDTLGLKPIITFENGDSKVLSKARGEKKAMRELLDMVATGHKAGTPYMLVWGNNLEQYQNFREACIEKLGQEPAVEYPVGCIIAANSGPNIIGIIFRK